jgi:hypothetical protein
VAFKPCQKIIIHCSKNAIGRPKGKSSSRLFARSAFDLLPSMQPLHLNALGHHASAAAFAAAQSFDEMADGSTRPYAEADEVAFGDDGFVPA